MTVSVPSLSTPQAAFSDRRKAFRALHERGCFVIPNPWDVGSARYLQHLGFPALATTSAGFAFSQGLPDFAGLAGLVPYAEINGLFAINLLAHPPKGR